MLFVGTITAMTAVREFDSKDKYGAPCKSRAMDLVVSDGDESLVATVFDANVQKCIDAEVKEGLTVAVQVKFTATESTARETGQKFWNQRSRIVFLSVLDRPKANEPAVF